MSPIKESTTEESQQIPSFERTLARLARDSTSSKKMLFILIFLPAVDTAVRSGL